MSRREPRRLMTLDEPLHLSRIQRELERALSWVKARSRDHESRCTCYLMTEGPCDRCGQTVHAWDHLVETARLLEPMVPPGYAGGLSLDVN